jgi:DNA helicase-2/ATP-dependent DNA helicase PcrA
MTNPQLISWLKEQASVLDDIIASACRKFQQDALVNRSKDQFGFDLAECQRESWNLSDGKDLCYDRPNTPFVYAMWYHGRRVNTFLTHFAETLSDARGNGRLDIFDLGAGTGAVQWAVGLVYHKLRSEGMAFPKLRIVNVDTSPFMLHFNRDYLWKYFVDRYPYCKDFSGDILYNINSWNNEQASSIASPWITASYLFDISDTSTDGRYKKAVLRSFQEIIDKYKPSKLLLLTARSKEGLVDEVAGDFDPKEYNVRKIKNDDLFLKGSLVSVNRLRIELFNEYQRFLSDYRAASVNRTAEWNDVSFVGVVITRIQSALLGVMENSQGVDLHSSSMPVRSKVKLNKDQEKAAVNANQPTVVIGPAGCGKSIVITERIKNIVDELDYNPELTILLTSFNKELLGQLKEWLLDILLPSKIRSVQEDASGVKIFFMGNAGPRENIRILHFDMLPWHLGGVPYWRYVNDEEHHRILNDLIGRVKVQNKITDNRYDTVLNAEFLLEEYYRVIYGLQVGIKGARQEYLAVARKGRGKALDQPRRELVWQCLEPYAIHIYSHHVPSFVLRRQLFLSKLKSGVVSLKFDYVVVDEFQDCTKADFEIFFHMLNDPNYLVMAGDLAQAVHLGRSANIEMLRDSIRGGGKTLRDIKWSYLDGSYRLPFRICEAIFKISEHINLVFRRNHAAMVLSPYKGAPPGARPIVVVCKDVVDLSTKIIEIVRLYGIFGLENNCILEKDRSLRDLIGIETDTVLRLKGLEKHCVIWSTRAGIEHIKEKFEFVYTILSRTSRLLIIALFDATDDGAGTLEIYKEAIELLDRERLIFWDKETKEKFPLFCQTVRDIDEEE